MIGEQKDKELLEMETSIKVASKHRRYLSTVTRAEEARVIDVSPIYVPDEYAEEMIAQAVAER